MPMISKGGLYKYLQSVQSYLAPPITAVFLLGLFFKRINAKGAVSGLAAGFILGMAKLIIQALVGSGAISGPEWLVFVGNYNFLFASGWLLGISVAIVVFVSLMTKAQDVKKISGLTYSTATNEDKAENRASWTLWDILASAAVLAVVLGLYLYFSFWLG
jgi:SSS family solute:Na+ symporter